VILVKPPSTAFHISWPVGFFPRKFTYKIDAKKLGREVELLGGKIEIKREA